MSGEGDERLRELRERVQGWFTPKRLMLLAAAAYTLLQGWSSEKPPEGAPREVPVSSAHSAYAAQQAWRFGLGTLALLALLVLLRAVNERQERA